MDRTTRIAPAILIIALLLSVVGCSDDESNPPSVRQPINTGSANFARYVAIGNSITAGYQSNALSARDQLFAYPNLLARHIGTSFEMPLMKDPGLPGRIRLTSLSPPALVSDSLVVSPLNANLTRPYNDLGIPGAAMFDMFDTTDVAVKAGPPRNNPFFAIVLRSSALGKTIVAQAQALQPTFITVWMGNNDVLGFAVTGGTGGSNAGLVDPPGTRPTEAVLFDRWYHQLIDTLQATGAGIVVANIPDLTTIPFFTTLGPQLRAGIVRAGVPLFYQRNGNRGLALDTTTLSGSASDPMIILSGVAYASLLGQPTGKWYRDNGVAPRAGIDTTKPFGFHPQNPWPDALTLDANEQGIARQAVEDFNRTIDSIATNRGIGIVDVHALLQTAHAQGIYDPQFGTFSTSFITGGLFSYDGVHPSSRAHAIIANEFIAVINRKFDAHIPPIALGSVAGIPIGKAGITEALLDRAEIDWGSLVRLLGGR